MNTSRDQTAGWTVILPLKPVALGKSRLTSDASERANLAKAVAIDTVRALCRTAVVAEVLIISDEPDTAPFTSDPRVRVIREDGVKGIDAAVAIGERSCERTTRRAAIVGDLPFLDADDLTDALAMAAQTPRAVVADLAGTGSTMVTANRGQPLRTRFGPNSLARHLAIGCTQLLIEPSSTVRWDVDSPTDLEKDVTSKLGSETIRVLVGYRSSPSQMALTAVSSQAGGFGR